MSAPAPSFGPTRRSAASTDHVSSAGTSPLRLSRRGELLIYALAFLVGFLSIPMGVWWT